MSADRSSVRLTTQELGAWGGLLRARARIGRVLEADLQRNHGLSANQHDVLAQLGLAPQQRLAMKTLADEVLMSPSGLSRLVDELARDGLVQRERRDDDARGIDVVLTASGRDRLREASRTHLALVREMFLDPLSAEQQRQLIAIWDVLDPSLVPPAARDAAPRG